MAAETPALDRTAVLPKAGAAACLEQIVAWLARNPALVFLAWSFWLSAEYLVFGSSSYVRIHDNGDATLPMLLSKSPPNGLPWNFLGLCGLDGWAWGVQLTSIFFCALPGWLAYGLFTWWQRFLAGYFMHRLLKDTLNVSLLPSLFAGFVYSQFSQPSNNASWAGFTLYDTLGLPGLPLLIWALYRLMKSRGWWWLPGGLLVGLAFGIGSPYAFAPFIFMACCAWVLIARPEKPFRLFVLAGLLIVGCALINLPTVWAGKMNAPLSHRAAWTSNAAMARGFFGSLQFGWSFIADNLLPLGLAALGLIISPKKNRQLITLAGVLALALLFVTFYETLMTPLQGRLGFLAGFQFSRVYLIIPFLAAAAGAIGWDSISSEWKLSATEAGHLRWRTNFSTVIFAAAVALLLWKSVSIKTKTLTELAGGANFATLYQNPQLNELAKKIRSEPPGRVATVINPNDPILHPGFAWAYGIETVDGYANLYPKRYQDFWEAVIGPLISADKERHDYFHYWGNRVYLFSPTGGFPNGDVRFKDFYRLELLSLANVRYVVSAHPLDDERLVLLPSAERPAQLNWAVQTKTKKFLSLLRGKNPGMPVYVYENQEVTPRYFLTDRVKMFGNQTELLAGLGNATHEELKSTVYLSGSDVTNPPSLKPSIDAGSVSVLSQTSSKIQLEVTNASASVLIAANLYSPLWKASVDGRPAQIFPADEAFQGISLEAGHHQVELSYEPPYSFKHQQ